HRAAVLAPAFPDAYAAKGGTREVSVVLGVLEVSGQRRGWLEIGAEPQVLVHLVRVDHLPRIHSAGRIPDRLELAERLHQLGAEHARQELGAGLAVAVLTRERPAITDHQGRRLLDELPVLGDAAPRLEIEVDARVET